jgi:hypothetical protein
VLLWFFGVWARHGVSNSAKLDVWQIRNPKSGFAFGFAVTSPKSEIPRRFGKLLIVKAF